MPELFAVGARLSDDRFPVVMLDGKDIVLILSSGNQLSWREFHSYLAKRVQEYTRRNDFLSDLKAATNTTVVVMSDVYRADWKESRPKPGPISQMYANMTGKPPLSLEPKFEAPDPQATIGPPEPKRESAAENRETAVIEVLIALGKVRREDVDQVRTLVHTVTLT